MVSQNVHIDDPRPWLMLLAVVFAVAFATMQDIKSVMAMRPNSIIGDIARHSEQGQSRSDRSTAYGEYGQYQ
jgi:hypothetical protein